MPRASSGTYSPPSTGFPFTAGSIISAAVMDAVLNDMATELQNSLDRAGRGGMTQPLKLADGNVNAPALSFNTDTRSGLYTGGLSDVRLAAGGTELQRWTPGAILFTLGVVKSLIANNSNAVAWTLDTANDLTAGGTKLLSLRRNGVEKAYFDSNGLLYIAGSPVGVSPTVIPNTWTARQTFSAGATVPTPALGTDATTKQYVDDAVSAETAARTAADSSEASARDAAIASAISVNTASWRAADSGASYSLLTAGTNWTWTGGGIKKFAGSRLCVMNATFTAHAGASSVIFTMPAEDYPDTVFSGVAVVNNNTVVPFTYIGSGQVWLGTSVALTPTAEASYTLTATYQAAS